MSEPYDGFMRFLNEGEHELTGRLVTQRAICPTCNATGTTWHGRPAHDAVSFTQDEWGELDYDTQDSYLSGDYDKTCPECKGSNVIDVIDREQTSTDVLAEWDKWEKDYWEMISIERFEMRAQYGVDY